MSNLCECVIRGAVMDKRLIAAAVLSGLVIFCFTVSGYAQETEPSISLEHCQALQAPVFLQLSDQPYLVGAIHTGTREQEVRRVPPSDAFAALAQYYIGLIGATVGVVPGAIYRWYGDSTRKKFLVGNTAMAIGSTLGSTIGVYLVGSDVYQTASFLATLNGSMLVSVPILAGVLGDIIGDGLGAYFLISGTTIGAVTGFQKACRYKPPPAESDTALINFRDGQMNLGVPRVYVRPDLLGSGGLSQRVDLLKVRF